MSLPFRQVHLDFHTSGLIPDIGSEFGKAAFQETLKLGHVDSITVFSKCHHGYSYHPTKVGTMHPHLKFDLLRAQLEACREIGVRTPIYISAGLDQLMVHAHPEWLLKGTPEDTQGSSTMISGYRRLCFNTPYMDFLLKQTEEVLQMFSPTALFFDIVAVNPCYCEYCQAELRARGEDTNDFAAVWRQAERVYKAYADALEKLVHGYDASIQIFHNAGHITKGRRDLAYKNTHLELESLPTGGWGYDHFPMSASYAMTLGMEYLGMTGKFHTSWGEFGGYKHPNALRYEAALSLAFSAKCSVGDQLHPFGALDRTTYALIGAAYSEVEEKEAYCADAENIADVAILSQEAICASASNRDRRFYGDIGANRIMLEGKYLYHIIDAEACFFDYKVIILPDSIRLNEGLAERLNTYLEKGGKILATGRSGLYEDKDEFAFDMGARFIGGNEFKPAYVNLNVPTVNEGGVFVMYTDGYDVALTCGEAVAKRIKPFFNREGERFCSHQHTPPSFEEAGPAAVVTEKTAYVAFDIFTDYAQKGSLHLKEIVNALLDRLLGTEKTLSANLPDRAIATLTKQQEFSRFIQHTLFAHTTQRGENTEIIESIIPLRDVAVSLRLPETVLRVHLEPQGIQIPFTHENGVISYTIDKVDCHQMAVIDYE